MTLESLSLFDIQVLDVEVVDVSLGVGLEEEVLLEQTEGQALEVVVEPLYVDLAGLAILLGHVPVKHVPSVENLLLLHALIVAPDAGLEEVHLHLLLFLVFDGKPDVLLGVQLVNELEQRPSLQQPVADLVLDRGQHLEELGVVNLRVAQQSSQGVGDRGLQLQQRLKGDFVYVLETVPEDLGEILSLEFAHQLLVDATDEQFSEDASSVHTEDLLLQLLLHQPLPLVLGNDVILDHVVDDHCLLLPLRCLNPQKGVNLVNEIEH